MTAGLVTAMPRSRCPGCRARIDWAARIAGADGPRPRTLAICAYCASLLRYDDDLRLVMVPVEEKRSLCAQSPRLGLVIMKTHAAVMNRQALELEHAKTAALH